MVRKEIERSISRNQLLAFAGAFNSVFYLDSCNVQDAMNLGAYDFLIGLGVKKSATIGHREKPDWQAVSEFVMEPSWKFAVFGYDLKEDLHGLESLNSDSLQWPKMHLVQPEIVIEGGRDGKLYVWADQPDEVIKRLAESGIMPDADVLQFSKMTESIEQYDYTKKVEEIRNEISEGNVYEMNLCIEYLLHDCDIQLPLALFNKLTSQSPAPFSAFVKWDNLHVFCSSPERFLRRIGNQLYSQPIKGTSSRQANLDEDEISKEQLRHSEKERAEHVMIVDLVRNDLSRGGVTGSTRVDELFGIYSFAHVHQMISTVACELKDEISLPEILHNTFPMGSMTGAPKYIAMQYIEALEQHKRSWFSGSVGYIAPNGDFDLNVVIRSLLYDQGRQLASFSVGGAITYDSDAAMEYEECQLKAKAIRQLFEGSD